MLIRTYADIEKLDGEDALSEAERTLLENCKIGEVTILGDGSLPDGPSHRAHHPRWPAALSDSWVGATDVGCMKRALCWQALGSPDRTRFAIRTSGRGES
ncbi:MAG: hypothetical protein U5N27_00555 [Rhizobium sp.]|nr:hypothetical protein [Rhizobium sp.]